MTGLFGVPMHTWGVALVVFAGLLIGGKLHDTDESRLRPWALRLRQIVQHNPLTQGLFTGILAAIMTVMLDYWLFTAVPARFEIGVGAGVSFTVLSLVFGGVGPVVTNYLLTGETRGIDI